MTELTREEKRAYVFQTGKGGIQTLAVIDRLKGYLNYREEDKAGSEFIDKIIHRHAVLMNRCYDSLIDSGTVDQKDVVSLREHLVILKEYFKILSEHDILTRKIKETKGINESAPKKPVKRTRRPFEKQQDR